MEQQSGLFRPTQEDMEVVERANLSPSARYVASTAVAALRFLQDLSAETGVPVEKMDAPFIVKRIEASCTSGSESPAQRLC